MAEPRRAAVPEAGFLDAGVLALLGALVFLDTLGYPPSVAGADPGPALFPRLLATLLIVGGAGLAARAFRRRKSAPRRPPPGFAVWGPVASIAGFLVILPWAGALVSVALLVAGLMWQWGERSPLVLAAFPLGLAGFIELAFG